MDEGNPKKVGRFEVRKDLFDSRRNIVVENAEERETFEQANDRLLRENLMQQENLRRANLNSNIDNNQRLNSNLQNEAAALPSANAAQTQNFTSSRFGSNTNPFLRNQRTAGQVGRDKILTKASIQRMFKRPLL